MKKKVLFALIALFSFVSAWADDVTVGEGENAYKVSLSTQYVALDATNGVDAPTIAGPTVNKGTSGSFAATVACVVDASGNKVDGKIKTAGTYYLLVNFNDGVAKVFKVPFYVTAPVEGTADYVYNATTWGNSYTGGALKGYYAKYPFEDLWGKPNGSNEEERCATITDRRCTFTSYASETGTEVYATNGIVQILEQKWDNDWTQILWTKVKVVDNGTGPEDFLDEIFYIKGGPDVLPENPVRYQLYANANGTELTDEQNIWVEISSYTAPGFTHTWEGCINAPDSKLPWICVNYNGDPKAVVFTYEGLNSAFPWGKDRLFGENRTWGVASVAQEFKQNDFLDPNAQFAGAEGWNNTKGSASTFDINKFNMLLIPADLVLTATVEDAIVFSDESNEVKVTCNSLPYNGAVQYPTFSGENFNATVTYTPATTGEAITLVEGRDFTPVYEAADDDYKSADTHNFTVNFIGEYAGSKAATYDIEKAHVNINLAHIYKTYGEADPTNPADFNFEIDASTPLKGADVKSDIAKYLVFQRASGDQNVGEDVREYEYYYGKTADFEEKCNYSISFLQTKSLLIIQKAPLEIKVTNNWKKYKQNDPTEFTFTVTDETQLKNGDTAADVDAVVKRAYSLTDNDETAVNARLEKVDGQDVAIHNEGAPVYAFDLEKEATNYAITFANNFEIVPSNDYSGIQVTVSNNAGNAQSNPYFKKPAYIYRGTEYKPGTPDTDEFNDLVVTDGENTLAAGVDYIVKSYANNIHVGDATVTVTLTGSYVEKDVTGTFTIKKAPLTITAKSYILGVGDPDPATFEVEYQGFVNEETAAAGNKQAKGFKAPSGVTKKAIAGSTGSTLSVIEDAKADDYAITYEDGALSFGETILIVKADDKNKTYGEEDPELSVTVKKVNDQQAEVEASDGEKAALNIGGTLAYTVTREKGENVDGGSNDNKTYPISVDGPTKLLDGVIVVYRPGEFDINVKTVTLKGDNATKVYGDANPTFEASVWEVPAGETDPTKATKWSDEKKTEEGVINPDFYYVGVQGATWNGSAWVLQNNNVTAADAEYAITPHFMTNNHYTSSGNYLVELGESGKFSITPAPLTIKAVDKSKSFSEADPDLTITATGLKRDDQLAEGTDYTIAREKFGEEGGENVGEYTITVTPVENSAVLKNYTVTLEPGTLTIGAMELAVIANDQAIYYGQTINPYDVKIIINGRPVEWTVDQIKKVLSLSTTVRKVGFNKDAFTLNKVENANYNIADDAFTNGWLTIGQLKEIPLGKADLAKITDVELKQVLEDHKGLTVDVKLPPRKMKADEWYSWVLPFDVKPSALFKADKFGYGAAEILDANKSAGSNVVFTLQVANEIPANTPFIVKVENELDAADVNALVFKNVTIGHKLDYVNADPATVADGVSFVGLYEDYKGPKANERYLAAVTPSDAPAGYVAHNEFWAGSSTSTLTIPRTMAILRFGSAEQAAKARIFIEDEDGTLTEINGVAAEADAAVAGEGWYTISGVKLNAQPTEKGIYIFNGKKVAIQ